MTHIHGGCYAFASLGLGALLSHAEQLYQWSWVVNYNHPVSILIISIRDKADLHLKPSTQEILNQIPRKPVTRGTVTRQDTVKKRDGSLFLFCHARVQS